MDILKELQKILKKKKINKKINLETNFKNDLHLDSLDLIDLIIIAEEKLNILIPDNELNKIKNVNDFINIVNELKKIKK